MSEVEQSLHFRGPVSARPHSVALLRTLTLRTQLATLTLSHSSLQKVLINKNKLSYCYHLLVLLLLLLHSSSLHNVFQGWENGGSGQAFNPTIVSSGAEGQSSDILASGAHALSTIPRFLPGTQAKLNIYLVGIII